MIHIVGLNNDELPVVEIPTDKKWEFHLYVEELVQIAFRWFGKELLTYVLELHDRASNGMQSNLVKRGPRASAFCGDLLFTVLDAREQALPLSLNGYKCPAACIEISMQIRFHFKIG
jgi:hypothetical protein